MPEPKGAPRPFAGSLRRLLGQMSAKRRGQLVLVFLLSLVGAVAEMATLGAVIPFLSILAGANTEHQCAGLAQICALTPLQISLGFGAIIVTAMVIRLVLLWASTRFAYALGADFGHEVYRRTLHQSYSFHVARNSSQIIAAVNKTNHLVTSVIVPMMQGGVAVIIVLAILAALIRIDVTTAVIAMTGISIFYLGISSVTRKILRRNSRIIAQAEISRVKILQEGLGGIREILLEASQPIYVRRFHEATVEQKRAQAANLFIRNTPRYVVEAAAMIMMVGLAWWIQQRQGLSVALPTLGALALGAQRMLPQLQQTYFAWSSLNASRAVIDDVMELLTLPMPENNATEVQPDITPGAVDPIVTIENLSFQYESGAGPVLRDVNLRIPRGSKVGFIGTTGSGKSTLIDLTMGLLDPTSGHILVYGEPLTSANRRSWQRRIAHVPQAVYLSDNSLTENIAFGLEKSDIDRDRVALAAEQAQLAGFIDSLPERYDTLVGERGVRLSGGQRQRIGLARALYKQADILVLDEATSALDDRTEAMVMQNIHGLGAETTVLMIAHRLTTLRDCDWLVEMSHGQIVKIGKYHEIVGV